MKIISLNTWAGIAGTNELLDFFKANQEVDVFCLQEIFNGGEDVVEEIFESKANKEYNLFNLIQKTLPNYSGFFRPHFKEHYGLAVFVKKDISVLEEGESFVHKYREYVPVGDNGFHARNIQYIKLEINGEKRTIINFHGLWNGQGKTDTEERITQSQNIINFIKENIPEDFVLCGDFNLRPDTESLKIFEDFGLRNLIKENNVQSTRTSHYTKEEKFADYAFVSSGIEVMDFHVMPDEVSDHAALYLEIK